MLENNLLQIYRCRLGSKVRFENGFIDPKMNGFGRSPVQMVINWPVKIQTFDLTIKLEVCS